MRLYLVWDPEGVCERTDSIVEDLFEAVDGDTDSEAAPRRRKDKKRKRKSSSDSSEDTEDKDEESGSDSESEKVGLDYWGLFSCWDLAGIVFQIACSHRKCQACPEKYVQTLSNHVCFLY